MQQEFWGLAAGVLLVGGLATLVAQGLYFLNGKNMKALISTVELVQAGYRVAQVEPDENIFPVAQGLFWTDCNDDVVADQFWYNPSDLQIKPLPQQLITGSNNQPISVGAQTL